MSGASSCPICSNFNAMLASNPWHKSAQFGENKEYGMLYYYKIKKKHRFGAKSWLALCCMSVLAWAYFYPGSLATVVPKLDKQVLPSLPTNIIPVTERSKPKMARKKPMTQLISLSDAEKAERELKDEGKNREAAELNYNLALLKKIEGRGYASNTSAKTIKQDIAKTISYFNAGNTSSKKAQILWNYDGGNLAYVYYPNYGVHFNPVTTSNLALDQYAKGNYKKVVSIADALLENATVKEYPGVGKYYIWQYCFDLQFNKYKFPAPWASGMAQGLVLDVVGKAYKITGDKKYVKAGELILNSFRVPWNEGGVTETDEHGNWYLEVAATDKLRILNGFLFTLDSIHNYYEVTHDRKALWLFAAGVSEAISHLQQYDLGYWSNYSLLTGDRASYGYHKIHVDLLKKLYEITKVPEFKTYANKFGFYLHNRFIDIPPTHPSFTAISALTEKGVITSTDGWFGAKTEISKDDLICWIARVRGWKPSTYYRGHYADIKRDRADWGYIEAAFDNGLQLADGQGLLNPDNSVSRAEMASILCKTFAVPSGKPPIQVQVCDIANNGQEKSDIHLALSNGLMDAYEPNYFRPNLKITREQTANILYKLLNVQPQIH